VIERFGVAELSYVQMDMADAGFRREAGPGFLAGGARQRAQVEWFSGHRQFVSTHAPLRPRAIGVHLDAKTVGIAEIQRLADEVIRRSGVSTALGEVRHQPSERGAIRQQDRKVIETEQPPARHGADATLLVQRDERRVVALRSQLRR
jgi:hypothetical protein